MSVSEDKVPGEEVGRLKAKDLDLGDNGMVNYRLIDGDGMSMFELSTDSETREAVIKLKKVSGQRSETCNYFFHPLRPPGPYGWKDELVVKHVLTYTSISYGIIYLGLGVWPLREY